MTPERVGALASAGAAILFGTSFVATAFALRAFGPVAVGAWRGALAAIVVGLLLQVGPARWRAELTRLDWADWARVAALGTLAGPVFILGMNVAVNGSGATIASFVAGLYAVLTVLLGPWLLGEPVGRGAVAAFVLALFGTALLAGLDPSPDHLAGIGAGIGAALAYTLYLVLARRWSRGERLPATAIALANFTMSTIVLVPLALLGGGSLVPATGDPDALVATLALGWLILGPSAAAQLLLVTGVRLLPARRTSAFLLLNPLSATAFAAVLLGERLAAGQAIGAALVLIGIALATGLPGAIAEAYARA